MNYLKIKFGFFSLLAALTVSVFLTSCEQEEVIETAWEEVIETTGGDLLLMPYGFNKLSKESQIEYFQNLTKEDIQKLEENNRIGSFLLSIGELENVTTELMSDGVLLTDVDISQVLSDEELSHLKDYEYNDLESRGPCGWWSTYYTYYNPGNCWYSNSCCTWSVQKRTCISWSGAYTQYRHVNQCD